ncbi:hypothetical protein ES702_00901 [subsurface metagenome]
MAEITKKDLKQLEEGIDKRIGQSEKSFKRHTDILYEKFRKDIKIISEGWDVVREKTDATFEMVGEIKKDIEIMKLDIQFIKTELKKFIRVEEFEALEKRVILIEKKLSRV